MQPPSRQSDNPFRRADPWGQPPPDAFTLSPSPSRGPAPPAFAPRGVLTGQAVPPAVRPPEPRAIPAAPEPEPAVLEAPIFQPRPRVSPSKGALTPTLLASVAAIAAVVAAVLVFFWQRGQVAPKPELQPPVAVKTVPAPTPPPVEPRAVAAQPPAPVRATSPRRQVSTPAAPAPLADPPPLEVLPPEVPAPVASKPTPPPSPPSADAPISTHPTP